MNYHSDQWIMDRAQEHYNEALEYFPKAGESFDLDTARVVAKKSIDHIDEMCDEFLKNEWSVDEAINALLDDVQYEIMRIAIKKEIGE